MRRRQPFALHLGHGLIHHVDIVLQLLVRGIAGKLLLVHRLRPNRVVRYAATAMGAEGRRATRVETRTCSTTLRVCSSAIFSSTFSSSLRGNTTPVEPAGSRGQVGAEPQEAHGGKSRPASPPGRALLLQLARQLVHRPGELRRPLQRGLHRHVDVVDVGLQRRQLDVPLLPRRLLRRELAVCTPDRSARCHRRGYGGTAGPRA